MSCDRLDRLRRAVWELPDEVRLYLFLSRAEALHVAELAELLGCTREAAREGLRRAEEALSQALHAALSEEREVS